jgi:small basic protein (TIGR04137 family)
MSIDRSLKAAGGLARHRNVLSRAERVEKMLAKEKFNMQSGDPLGLPKVANRKVSTGKAAAKKKDAAEGTPAA